MVAYDVAWADLAFQDGMRFGMKRMSGAGLALGACLCGVLIWAGGCAPSMDGRALMGPGDTPPASPPPGKAMVVFHRPETFVAGGLNMSLWDEEHFIATTQGGEGVAYVCDPGARVFVGRCEQSGNWGMYYFGESTTAVDADLEADRVYDIYCEAHWRLHAHVVKLRPVTAGQSDLREKVSRWMRKEDWVSLKAGAAELAEMDDHWRPLMKEILLKARSEEIPRLRPSDVR